jgi:uncharacterized repeat protein (TIGR04052 family)
MRTRFWLASILCICLAAATVTTAATGLRTYHIRFAAMVGGKPFHCGTVYEGVGIGRDAIATDYFRFYVSKVRLVDSAGRETPLALEQDGTWQQHDVAFLSFERGVSCANGSPQDREEIVGSAPDGTYVGLRFTLGIPQALDHGDATIAQSPLNLSDMFWSWQDGYKFLRLDARVRARSGKTSAFVFHLGSTGCTMNASATHCRATNEARVELAHFDPSTSTVVADVAALLKSTDLERNGGCMMAAGENCSPELAALGVTGSTQSVFLVR